MNSRLHRVFAGTPGLLTHSLNVMLYTRQVIDYLPDCLINLTQAQDLLIASLYHDVGKATWHDNWFTSQRYSIRNVDWTVMQMHPIQSVNTLHELGVSVTEGVRNLILKHHERPGGGGYPYGIEPDFYSLILASTDVFCACTESRAYRPYPMDTWQALKEVAGFAPEIIVDAIKHATRKIA